MGVFLKEELLKKLYGSLDYNTFSKLNEINKKIFSFSIIASYLLISKYNQSIVNPATFVSLNSLLFLLSNNKFNGESFTKDIFAIKALYNEVIKDINNINTVFEFNNPLEIFYSYIYLLDKGYLSKDKKFHFNPYIIKDIPSIMGSNVILGEGVCRHISSMLEDIYKDGGISNGLIAVISPIEKYELINNNINISEEISIISGILNDQKYPDEIKLLYLDLLKELDCDYSVNYENDKDIYKGNHVINFVKDKDKTYFLDPTNGLILKKDKDKRSYLTNENGMQFKACIGNSTSFKNGFSINKLLKTIDNSDRSYEEDNEILLNATIVLMCNQDILENFYNKNADKYNEISEKVLKIKTKRI